MSRKRSRRPTRLLLPFLRKEWKALGSAGLSSIVVAVADLARPVPLALVVNHLFERATGTGSFELTWIDAVLLAGIAALVIAISLVDALASYVADLQLKRAGERIVHELRLATHGQLQRLSLAYHSTRKTGDLVTRVTGDVNAVGAIFSQSLGTVVAAVLLLGGMVAVSVILDPVLALVAFGAVPLLAFVTFRARRRLKSASRAQRAREGEIAALAAESFAAIREVKAFASERYEHDRLREKSIERREAGIEASRIESRFARTIDLLGAVGVAAVLVVGVLRVASGALSPGELIVMMAYAKRLYRPLRDIARQAGQIARSLARAERIAEVLAADQLLEERPNAYRGGWARGDVELDAVHFSYDADRTALEGVSLEVASGQKLALVGPSGAGKSTVAALVARFYDPDADAGVVRIDGRDLRDCSLDWLRRQVGLVLQDTVLFSGTVAENIAYGLNASREEIEAAAKAADAHAFIVELPEGYETRLGQRGIGLSGGQRQRLAVARTLLRDPPILVLDEPTAGLDADTEAEVVRGLRRLLRGRTAVVISHSPSLLDLADRVVRMEGGRIVEARSAAERRRPATSGPARRPAPRDPALPRAATLLDAEAMTLVLHRALRSDAPEPDVRIRYLRYKPGTNLVVHYDVGLDDEWHEAVAMIASGSYLRRRALKPENRALARLVDGRSPAPDPLVYDAETDALVQWLPLDLALPALAEPPESLQRRIESAGAALDGSDGEPARLAYKPRRRVVLRFGSSVVKHYADEDEFEAAVVGLRESARTRALSTPSFDASLPDLLLTVQPLLAGTRPEDPADAAGEAGEFLAGLHALPPTRLRATSPADQLRAAANSAGLVAVLRPELAPRLEGLLARLEETLPTEAPLVSTHGDFNARQLLLHRGELSVVDFDAMSAAPGAVDLATYAAYVVLGGDGDLDRARMVLHALLDGYGEPPEALSWYLSTCILRRSPRPFRYLDEHWPVRVESMVAASEAALAG